MHAGDKLAKVLMYYGLIDYPKEGQKIVCPFHGDINPSMIINYSEGSYFCFGCYKSGDALSFVINAEKLNGKNELEACKIYNKIIKSKRLKGVTINSVKRTRKEVQQEKKEELDRAKDYYYGLKKIDWNVYDFEEVKEVGLYMTKRGFSRRTLTKIKAKVTFNSSYPIIFPIYDNKKFKGWVCRTTDKKIEKRRKYLYNKGFVRAETLVGQYDRSHPVVLVEGFMDMLKFRQFGYRYVVAILGWKLSECQIQKLKAAGCEHIISALDNDECGKKGTRYASNFFQVTRWQYLKGIKDPGEMNKEKWQKMFERTMIKYKEDKRKWDC